MKRIICALLTFVFMISFGGATFAISENPAARKQLQAAPNAKTVELAFVFDGPSDKNAEVLKTFQTQITRSLLPDYKASFPQDLIFTGDWSEQGAVKASDKALASRAFMVISLGYMSSSYYVDKPNKNKYVVTIDQYGLRDFGDKFFNPVQQSVNDFILFKKLVPQQKKVAVLMNENFYKTRANWNALIDKKLKEKNVEMNYVVLPVGNDVKAVINKIPADVDSVFVTPLYNITAEQKKELYNAITAKKLYSFSSVGKEDVNYGALLGTSAFNVDKKLAEATSFSIHGVLHGNTVKTEKIPFFDDKVIFYNKDTGEALGYAAPLRLLNNAEIVSNKEVKKYDLNGLLTALEESNLDMLRKKFLVQAARRATTSAYLRYLPTLRLDLGHQTFNKDYAFSYSDVPIRAGQFVVGMDQVIYSPDLVTNIIVKHKKLKFDKAEKALTDVTMGFETANLYVDMLMLENVIKVQEEYVNETREILAMARVRQQTGKCGNEEVLRWAGEVSEAEKKLLSMKAEYDNIKIHINKLLYHDQKEHFVLNPLTATDPAFFTSELHIIDHVRTPEKLAKFTDMLVAEVIYMSPETTKLKAAIAMKKAEISNYAQKFIMPNAKLTVEYATQFDRSLPYETYAKGSIAGLQMTGGATDASGNPIIGSPLAAPRSYWGNTLDKNYGRVFIAAQWKPIEGGTKIAEIARAKAELNELNAYLEQVNTELEMNVRSVVNRAIAKYFIIEKSYKAMFAEAENYQMVKAKYLMGTAPINQIADAQHMYFHSKVEAMNSQNEFFKELLLVQRGLIAMNWTKAHDRAKEFIHNIPKVLPAEADFSL
ncbi:TolC family protein [bacterium]|nr:TolC family protein [bacterium]